MLRASLAGRERLPVPHHSGIGAYEIENDDNDDDETYGLNGGRGERRFHRKNLSWPSDEFRFKRSLITRIVTKPCRSIRALFLLVVSLFVAFWYITTSIRPGATTFVYHEADTHRVWEWEIQSGHWMSWRPIKKWFHPPRNPSLPSPTSGEDVEHAGGVIGCGWQRQYIHVDDLVYSNTSSLLSNTTTTTTSAPKASQYLQAFFPPRPAPGSIVDFDIVSQYCDLTTGQYLRTCLSFLRLGAALFSPPSLHKPAPKDTLPDIPAEQPYFYVGSTRNAAQIPKKPKALPNDWRYAYVEDRMSMRAPMSEWTRYGGGRGVEAPLELDEPKPLTGGMQPWKIGEGTIMIGEAERQQEKEREKGGFKWKAGQCEEDYPRIVHMYMEQGQFGDAPYMTLLSFLYSQNLGLGPGGSNGTAYSGPCRPEFWVWIGAEEGTPTTTWEKRIASNSWSEVFTDKAYRDIIKFKRWNTTEQMDALPEIASAWRHAASLDIRPKHSKDTTAGFVDTTAEWAKHGDAVDDEDFKKRSDDTRFSGRNAGDVLHDSLGLSRKDTARWVLPHRYGGVYVEPGLLFLRDWEELWNFRGAFSTRAFGGDSPASTGASVLKLNKRSALGTLVLRTALRHGMAMDARAVQTYVEDAVLTQMLFPMPEMLEDLTYWSNEAYQRLHPTAPILESPQEFFESAEASLPASAIGVSGFFRGAWFYHAKPERDMPFDVVRNFAGSGKRSPGGVFGPADKWEVPWSAVFKRTFEAFMRGEQPNMYGEWLAGSSPL